MESRKGDRHKKPRLPPISMDQEEYDRLMALSERLGLPLTWVVRKLLSEALEQVDWTTLPTNLMRPWRDNG